MAYSVDTESSLTRLYDETATASITARVEQAVFSGASSARIECSRLDLTPVACHAVLFVMTEQPKTSRLGSLAVFILMIVDGFQVSRKCPRGEVVPFCSHVVAHGP